jgi:GNAT superfamily N-acetyltransferase
MNCPSEIRVASPADKVEVWRLFLQAHKENGLFTLAPEKVGYYIDRALFPETIHPMDTGPRGVIGVIGEVGTLEGLAYVSIGSLWYTHDRHVNDVLVYVDPECRRSNHAKALIEWLRVQADTTGLPLMAGVVSNVKTESKVRLYERMLPKVGSFFFYRSSSCNGLAV